MNESLNKQTSLGARLLQQDAGLTNDEYRDYRMKIEMALNSAERAEKRLTWIAGVSFGVGLVLMFVGGDKTFGSFDPYESTANAVSITLGVIYVAANILFLLSIAVYFLRYRPRLSQARFDIRDADILALKREVNELRDQIAATSSSKRDP